MLIIKRKYDNKSDAIIFEYKGYTKDDMEMAAILIRDSFAKMDGEEIKKEFYDKILNSKLCVYQKDVITHTLTIRPNRTNAHTSIFLQSETK